MTSETISASHARDSRGRVGDMYVALDVSGESHMSDTCQTSRGHFQTHVRHVSDMCLENVPARRRLGRRFFRGGGKVPNS